MVRIRNCPKGCQKGAVPGAVARWFLEQRRAWVAQSAERLTRNEKVRSSILRSGSHLGAMATWCRRSDETK